MVKPTRQRTKKSVAGPAIPCHAPLMPVTASSLLIGFALGFVVALQLGPMSAWIIHSTLRAGLKIGAAIGAGVAVVDGIYAALGVAGVAAILHVDKVETTAGVIGALLVGYLGLVAIRAARNPDQHNERAVPATPTKAFVLSLGATAINPATIGSWAAIFAGLGTSGRNLTALVLGVALGSLAWMTLLSAGINLVRHGLGKRGFQLADLTSGVCMLLLAAFLAFRALS